MSVTPPINHYFRISPKINVKIRNDPNGILRGPGETDSLKSLKLTISCQFPFEVEVEEIVCKGLRLKTRKCLCHKYCILCKQGLLGYSMGEVASMHREQGSSGVEGSPQEV
jgi:hypothetical protein